MGIGSEDTTQEAAQEVINAQLAENKAELERKKENLYQTRLDIIKGQGGENWTPNVGSRYGVPNNGS